MYHGDVVVRTSGMWLGDRWLNFAAVPLNVTTQGKSFTDVSLQCNFILAEER